MEPESSITVFISPPLIPISSQMHPVHTFLHYFPKISIFCRLGSSEESIYFLGPV